MRQGAPVRPPTTCSRTAPSSSPIPGHTAAVVLGQGKPPGGAELAELRLSKVSFTCALLVFGERVLPYRSAPGEHFLFFAM